MLSRTETQDGKLLVDAQFAATAKHVRKIVSQGYDVAAPSRLVMAL